MDLQLSASLEKLRRARAFDARAYLEGKARLINDYLRSSGVSACVVGVSGGIDSAVTLGLLRYASRQPGSPIGRLVAALMPMFVDAGATNQDGATARGREVALAFDAEIRTLDLSSGLESLKSCVDAGMQTRGEPWAAGQLVSYIRTPALYYTAALLAEQGALAVVCGTTNRDEGSYIGFFGKASDGMVDIQPISDIHKSEVRQLARLLGVPRSVIDAMPSGDTYDGRPDEEMIGAPYDFVELYELLLCLEEEQRQRIEAAWDAPARAEFGRWQARVEELHAKNLHKYLAGSPALHLDIYERAVPGGWRSECSRLRVIDEPPRGRLVGEFELEGRTLESCTRGERSAAAREEILDYGDSAFVVRDALGGSECGALFDAVAAQSRIAVGRNGMLKGFDASRDEVGSYRASSYCPELAELIWERIARFVPRVRTMDDLTPTDWNGHRVWRAIGINPVLRFIWYQDGGLLVPHYDAGYDFEDGHRHTLMSLVIYLSDAPAGQGGETRFLLDRQRHLPLGERDFSDWSRLARPDEVLTGVRPRRGSALAFDHRVLHDAETWHGEGARLLLRTDIVFERCGLLPVKRERRMPVPELYAELGLEPGACPKGVDRAFEARAAGPAGLTAQERLDWKMLRDPYYSSLFLRLGNRAAVEEGGFFDDGGPAGEDGDRRRDPSWLVTPIHKARERLAALRADDSRWPAALITTGALCPVHEGHLSLMELARKEAEKQGAYVLAGYLSAGHDDYVKSKCGPDAPTALHRIQLCQKAVEASDWLMTDPWEALHTSRAVNFTEVVDRLERYLSTHLRCARPIRVIYVFGSDNARFALAFVQRGMAICVPRPGFEDRLEQYARLEGVHGNARIIMSRGPVSLDAASSSVRSGDHTGLAEPVRQQWRSWSDRAGGVTPPPRASLRLRNEGEWSVSHWQAGRDGVSISAAWSDFVERLRSSMVTAFTRVDSPDRTHEPDVTIVSLEEQRRRSEERRRGKRVISLDPCLPAEQNLGVSRCFQIADASCAPRIVARPGYPNIESQLALLEPGEYLLSDDDSHTGFTARSVAAMLPDGCRISRIEKLVEPHDAGAEVSDLGDCRDFLLGSNEGGLVVALPNGDLARAPYCLPYVQPSARISVPVSSEIRFSLSVWLANQEFFARISPAPTVFEAAPAARALLEYLGFAPHDTLEEVSRWHVESLSRYFASR